MAVQTSRGIPLSSIHPRYLHSNSTSHIWPFSAIAELIDNAYDPDVNAKQFWISKSKIESQDCLIFMDNGKGMDYDKMYKMLSFGYNDKHTVKGHVPVGQYGNGFKSGSMRLGDDAIVFSKKDKTMCVGLLSQTYHKKIQAQNVTVPIVNFTNTGENVSDAPDYMECLHDILTHSLFKTKEDLLSEFSVIDGFSTKSKNGTRIIIWNLRRTSSGNLEFDFEKDRYDIQIPVDVYKSIRGTNKQQAEDAMQVPESGYSLRAYCSILYLKPKMQIIIQGQKVETQYVSKTLAQVMKDTYKPVCIPPLKQPIKVTFGYNTKSREHYGLMMYHKNRLIKAYERVACQNRAKSSGVGVIGVIECNYLIPTHNKQEFDNTDEYRRTMLSLGTKLEEYWKEVRYRLKNVNCTEPAENLSTRPDQNWIQCDECMKWRKLPDCVDGKQPKKWFCKMNPDNQFRSCEVEEEPEDSDDELRGYQKTYKQDEKNQKIKEEKKSNEQQSPSSPNSSCQTSSSSDTISSSHTGTGSRAPDDISIDNQNTPLPSTPTRMKRALDPNQVSPAKKKARVKNVDTTPDSSSIASAIAQAYFTPFMDHTDSGNEAQIKEVEIAQMEDGDDGIDKSTVKKGQSNEFTSISTEDEQTYKLLYLQAMDDKKQLQNEVDSLKNENCKLLTSSESLQKDLEEKKKKIEKVRVEDREVQTDFPSSCAESTATSADISTFESGRDSQQHETQDKPETGQENSKIQFYRLRELRQNVARLLVTSIPELDLQQVNYDCEVIDEILAQFIEEKEASTYK